MSPLKIPQVTLPPNDHPVDLEQFIHGSDVPSTLEDAFDKARRALEATNSFNEVKAIRDQAETLRAHARRVKWSLEIQNQCAEIKLRAERKAGSILATLTIRGGGGSAITPRMVVVSVIVSYRISTFPGTSRLGGKLSQEYQQKPSRISCSPRKSRPLNLPRRER